MARFKHILIVGTIMLLNGCATVPAPSPESRVSVYKTFGSVQCQDGGASLSALQRQLEAADIKVFSSACGNDGKIYPAVCGAPDGRIGIFEIPQERLNAASAQGFASLRNLPDASKTACR